jgi:hypothetical protein
MAARYPEIASRVIAVMNGYDEDPPVTPQHGPRFVVAFAGSIYLDRDPRIFFRAAARVVRELNLSPAEFGIELIGGVGGFDGVPIGVIAAEEGLHGFVGTQGWVPRHEAAQLLARAPMLISLPQDSDMAIPSKIFEYMQYEAWILALADRESATERLLRDSAADVVAPHDVEGMAAVLRRRYLQYARGERPTRLARESRFSRREQARRLFDAIAACLPRVDAPRDPAPALPRSRATVTL